MRWQPPAAALLLALASVAAAQVRISGVVTEQSESPTPVPVPEAFVLVRAGSPERNIAEAVTDSRGRYTLAGLPVGRLTLSVRAQSYYTVKAGDVEADSIARSCPQEGDCGGTSFKLARAAVVEGRLTDAFGDPLQDVEVELAPEGPQPADPMERMRRTVGGAVSDDRGYFRIWGVKPGRYELTAQQSRFGMPRPGAVEAHRQTIEIAPGETSYETPPITLGADAEVFSIRGTITGLDEDSAGRINIAISPEDENAGLWQRYETPNQGAFTISGLRKGRYVLQLADFRSGDREVRYLATVDVDHDIEGLELSPQPPSGIRGSVEFVDSPPTNLYVALTRPGRMFFGRAMIEVKGPDYEFENVGVAPGEYELHLQHPDYYLVDEPAVIVALGRVQDMVLRVSNVRSTVRGVARLAAGEQREPGAHFTVGLRGERGRHKIQADDSGAFIFEKLIPGDYEIAAWEDPDVDVHDDAAWSRAGENVKRLAIEAGFETEVDLTVTR